MLYRAYGSLLTRLAMVSYETFLGYITDLRAPVEGPKTLVTTPLRRSVNYFKT